MSLNNILPLPYKKTERNIQHENGSFKYLEEQEVLQTLEEIKINQNLHIPMIAPISIAESCMAKKTENQRNWQ